MYMNHYKIHYYNMIHAVEQTALTMEGAPYCRRLLFNLSKGLNRVTGNDDIKGVLNDKSNSNQTNLDKLTSLTDKISEYLKNVTSIGLEYYPSTTDVPLVKKGVDKDTLYEKINPAIVIVNKKGIDTKTANIFIINKTEYSLLLKITLTLLLLHSIYLS